VGPKLALTIMSRMSLPVLEGSIRNGDVASLSKCPGIGKKTAERLVVELRAKVGASGEGSPVAGGGPSAAPGGSEPGDVPLRDAVLALTTLGYKAADADAAVRRAQIALGAGAGTEKLIKHALSS
jgi:Holliday junction DNA helicase RuvA